ncbi:unnamed protein product [Trichogramma brassicae]|uniref:Uncharacterized protein n=1 Tax=Trichogramma brassicae TaxID=86971 RepID=A0A6H5J1G1_9HYME|nr:unnamed protein product [Trichogramma brassicae]
MNKEGLTPLHVALGRGHKNMAESLLKRGADPNVSDANGCTPLHIIITTGDIYFVKIFFKVNDEVNQSVQVDAVDESGHTPLRCAVARLWPDIVDFLLDRGAKLSSFIFPTEDHFDKYLMYENEDDEDKLVMTSHTLAVVDGLEKRGYELSRSDAMTIMKLFAKNQVFDDQLVNLKDYWCDDENFALKAKEVMISSSVSLCDLIQCRPEQTTKLLTYLDYWRFAYSNKWKKLPNESHEPCLAYLCEIMSRGFFPRWTLEFFLELTRYLLPILCCDMIIKNLENKDLLAICLTAMDQGTGNDDDLVKVFFTICDEKHQLVQIEAQDKLGQSPLHRALYYGNKKAAELLLRRGAKQNLADENGSTPLHIICEKKAMMDWRSYSLRSTTTKISWCRSTSVTRRVEHHCTWLCFVASRNQADGAGKCHEQGGPDAATRGSGPWPQKYGRIAAEKRCDPNVSDANGCTPLHIIITTGDIHFVKIFFKVNDEVNQSVQVDAVDESGHTPLRCAVARLWPDIVDFLLDRGAKLSSFIFPTEDQFDKCLVYENEDNEDKLVIASRILSIVDSLEKRGYELGRRDALMVMKLFAKNQVFDESMTNLEDYWYADEDFAIEANEIMISPSLSLFDLIHHRSEETTKLLTYSDYWRFVNSSEWADLPDESCEPCFAYLCEIMSRGFFRRWALEFF